MVVVLNLQFLIERPANITWKFNKVLALCPSQPSRNMRRRRQSQKSAFDSRQDEAA